MPEIKHTFQAGKMNKDLDERLVPNGEYRDAMNIQVRTTDANNAGSIGDAGTVQNIKGNVLIEPGAIDNQVETWGGVKKIKTIASVGDEKNDKAYFFLASPSFKNAFEGPQGFSPQIIVNSIITTASTFQDSIIEVDVSGASDPQVVPVVNDIWGFVDIYGMNGTNFTYSDFDMDGVASTLSVSGNSFASIPISTKLRIGMIIRAYNSNGINVFGIDAKIKDIDGDNIILYNPVPLQGIQDDEIVAVTFEHERALNFDYNGDNITGINIIDNLLFWTDNQSEPKKINIDRCKTGTPDFNTHTQLYITNQISDNLSLLSDIETPTSYITNNDLKEKHITVIRRAPTTAPTLDMRSTVRDGLLTYNIPDFAMVNSENSVITNGDQIVINNNQNADGTWGGAGVDFSDTNFEPNDILTFTQVVDDGITSPVVIKARFVNYVEPNSLNVGVWNQETSSPNIGIKIIIIAVDNDLLDESYNWLVELELKKPLFETKFCRFGYRYKYEDGEYSSFSPWSEIAFLPSEFDYIPKKGYNLGMVNNVRELIIKDFIPINTDRPNDVIGVDILFKTTDSPNVYTIKSIFRDKDPEWVLFTLGNYTSDLKTGELNITSEMIHRAMPANQLLRSWDNVPRFALAQEIVANRLLYGNYTQGYRFNKKVNLKQILKSNSSPSITSPEKSIKSLRSYKFGMVFGDKYGRETPIVESTRTIGWNSDTYSTSTGDIVVGKEFAPMQNKFLLQQEWGLTGTSSSIESWMEYVKYYVKETSNEYYNLVMDRWYDADDGNIWLSFASADRNKVDEETYLILKNQHTTETFVEERARYKIIAIKNEAPDFIKIDHRIMGEVTLDPTQSNMFVSSTPDTNATAPQTLMGATSIMINSANWDGTLNRYGRWRGNLKMRFIGKTLNATTNVVQNRLNTGWVTVTNYKDVADVDTDGDDTIDEIRLYWNKPFEQQVNMYQRFLDRGYTLDSSTDNLTYFVEIKEEVVENKPEFDGRFFVKIERDVSIDESIMAMSLANTTYDPVDTFKVGYIDTQGENPGNIGDYADYAWEGFPGTEFNADWEDYESDNSTNNPLGVRFFALGKNDISTGQWSGVEAAGSTQNYWSNWMSQGGGANDEDNLLSGNQWFIDGARSRKWRWDDFNDFEGDDEIDGQAGKYYKPNPLDSVGDGITTGTLNRIIFSMISIDSSSQSTSFRELMSDPGTLFTFNEDDSGDIYQVLAVNGEVGFSETSVENNTYTRNFASIYSNVSGFDDPAETITGNANDDDIGDSDMSYIPTWVGANVKTTTCTACGIDTGTDWDTCKRKSFRIIFAKYDQNTGATFPGNPGIDPNDFDPRGAVKHDGTGVLSISVVAPYDASEGVLVPIKGAAVWETEPKKDVDLDLYYEASDAIPMKLKEGNTLAFTPINSTVTAKNNTANGLEDVSFLNLVGNTPTAVYCAKVDDVKYTTNTSIVKIVGNYASSFWEANCEGDETLVINSIGINTDLYFEHKNGTKTNAKVTDIYEVDPYVQPVTRVNITLTLLGDANTPNLASVVGNGAEAGMVITGSGVGAGTWLGAFNSSGEALVLGNYSWMTIGQAYNVELIKPTGYYEIEKNVFQNPIELGWFNCYSYGNGVESDRIRDDFNAPMIDNGVKVSTTFSGYGKEIKSSGLIHSGLYNSTSEVNDLNEFNMGEKIIKELNPVYGSIQALKTRDTDVVVFTEDKVLKVLASKDAVYNADGNPQLVATNRTLGQTTPFVGDFGISKNPESLAWDQYRLYFTDMQRGAVLRLSRDGLTPISNVGMKTWFRDNLKNCNTALGTFDKINGEYNLTLKDGSIENTTASFNEGSKGWVSFKSFIPQAGVSVSNKYITAKDNNVYEHYKDIIDEDPNSFYFGKVINRNTFYPFKLVPDSDGVIPYYSIENLAPYFTESSIDILFNDNPGSVKSFQTMNYEGSQARIKRLTTENVYDSSGNFVNSIAAWGDNEYYNLSSKPGWWVNSFETDLQSGQVVEFIDKENKWFNKIVGTETTLDNLDTNEFSVQGIGVPDFIEPPEVSDEDPTITGCTDPNACNFNPQAILDDNTCEYAADGFNCDGELLEQPIPVITSIATQIPGGPWNFGNQQQITINEGDCFTIQIQVENMPYQVGDSGVNAPAQLSLAPYTQGNTAITGSIGSLTFGNINDTPVNFNGMQLANNWLNANPSGFNTPIESEGSWGTVVFDTYNYIAMDGTIPNAGVFYATICTNPTSSGDLTPDEYFEILVNDLLPSGDTPLNNESSTSDQADNMPYFNNINGENVAIGVYVLSTLVLGCMDSTAANYNEFATEDDGSCIYPTTGCTDTSENVMNTDWDCIADPNCVGDINQCIYCVYGCMDPDADNYVADATCDSEDCIYPLSDYNLIVQDDPND